MSECQKRIDELNECIKSHVENQSIWSNLCELRMFSNGCGVFAIRDIEPNELLLGDKPLIVGPTGNKHEPVVCALCFELINNDMSSSLCVGQCGLVLCGRDVCKKQHENECKLLQKWKPKNPNKFSFVIAKAMLVIRAIFLNDEKRKFLDLMQKNYEKDIYFDKEFEHFPEDKETVTFLRAASAAMNTNAFKVLYRTSCAGDICVRGFYPIMSLINHTCSPNTRHDVDDKLVGRIFAVRPIKKDEQICISYSQLLWGTGSRRMHMMVSKQFSCACNRCADPTENSTYLSAVRCQDKTCSGFLLPIEPIKFQSDAKCNLCGTICERKRFLQIQEMFATITKHFLHSHFTLAELKHFIESRLYKNLPDCNQFVVQAKLKAIWKCDPINFEGPIYFDGIDQFENAYFYMLIFIADQMTIKKFCEDILKILDKLGAGECSLKGFLAHKLYTVRQRLKTSKELFRISNDGQTSVSFGNISFFFSNVLTSSNHLGN